MKKIILPLFLILTLTKIAYAGNILEPKNGISNNIALTIDMCGGKTDSKIINLLIEHNTKATFFVSGKWIEKNEDSVKLINKYPELFRIENHGLNHYAAIINKSSPYKLKTVGNIDGLSKEVLINDTLISDNFYNLNKPTYYRTAGAQYTEDSIDWIKSNKYKVGSYTIAADGGAKFSADKVFSNLNKAKNGDIILIHGNHPESGNYIALKKYLDSNNKKFVWLE